MKKPVMSNPSFRYKTASSEKREKQPITPLETENKDIIPLQTPEVSKGSDLLRAATPYEFKTKQRPLEYTYFYRTLRDDINRTSFNDNFWQIKPWFTIPSRKFLLINYLKATIMYRYLVEDERPNLYKCYECDYMTQAAGFSWGINVTTQATYDSNSLPDYTTYTTFAGDFITLNSNVLENGSSSTTLYLKENQSVSAYFKWLAPENVNTFFPEAINGGVADPVIVYELRGHITNMSEFYSLDKLKR